MPNYKTKSKTKKQWLAMILLGLMSALMHLKRSVLMARDLKMDAYPSPTPTTRYRSLNSQLEFITRETYFYFVYLVFKI